MAKELPIYCWADDIDADTYAVIARCYRLSSGWWYGMSVFIIIESKHVSRWNPHRWREMAKARFMAVLEADHRGHLPVVGRADDTWGDVKEHGLG